MMTTATSAMTTISSFVRCPPRSNADMPASPTACGAFFRPKLGMVSRNALSKLPLLLDRDAGLWPALMVDATFDLHDPLDEFRPRLDIDGARTRNVDVVDAGDAPRPRRHDDDAVGQEDRFGY